MKKSFLLIALMAVSSAFGYTRWCQQDQEKPREKFDYFVAGDNETCYIQLSPEAKDTLKRMLENSDDEDLLDDVIDRVTDRVETRAGEEALQALQEMADNDPDLPAGVVKDGMFGGGEMLQKARSQRQSDQQ